MFGLIGLRLPGLMFYQHSCGRGGFPFRTISWSGPGPFILVIYQSAAAAAAIQNCSSDELEDYEIR